MIAENDVTPGCVADLRATNNELIGQVRQLGARLAAVLATVPDSYREMPPVDYRTNTVEGATALANALTRSIENLATANERSIQLARERQDLATLVHRLAWVCRVERLKNQALDYLKRKGLEGTPLRRVMSDEYNLDDDIDSVMRTVLAEHPADDETPITELWWCDMNNGSRFMFSSDECLMLYLAVDGMIELCVSDGGLQEISYNLPHIKTRGDVRMLCRALGVEVKG